MATKPDSFENSQTAKALKVIAAFRVLASEYEAEGEFLVAGTIRVHAMTLPLDSLWRLYDMLNRPPAPLGADENIGSLAAGAAS